MLSVPSVSGVEGFASTKTVDVHCTAKVGTLEDGPGFRGFHLNDLEKNRTPQTVVHSVNVVQDNVAYGCFLAFD